MRYAIYFTPDRSHPLSRAAAAWLGRDPYSNEASPQPVVAGMTPVEISFHAALKAPFRRADLVRVWLEGHVPVVRTVARGQARHMMVSA